MEARAFLTQPGRSFGARIHAELAAKHEALSKAQLDAAHAVGLHHWQSARDANSFGRFCKRLQTRAGVDNGGDARPVHGALDRSHVLFDAISEDERVGIVNDGIASHRCGARGALGAHGALLFRHICDARGAYASRRKRNAIFFRSAFGMSSTSRLGNGFGTRNLPNPRGARRIRGACIFRTMHGVHNAHDIRRASRKLRSGNHARACGGRCGPSIARRRG